VLISVRIFTLKEDPTMALCTECEAEVALVTGTEVGEILQCPDCGLDLEVVSLEPPVLAPAPEEEEDWGE
jgi:alpha-aminoadipate/glutamate carrier protein LysW